MINGIAQTERNEASEYIEHAINPSEVEPVLQELARLVWEDDVDAGRLLEELKSRMRGTKFTQEIDSFI